MKYLIFIILFVSLPLGLTAVGISPEIQGFINLFNQVLGEKNAQIIELQKEVIKWKEGCQLPEPKPIMLKNDYGTTYYFADPSLNMRRVQELIDSGFQIIHGERPDWVIVRIQ